MDGRETTFKLVHNCWREKVKVICEIKNKDLTISVVNKQTLARVYNVKLSLDFRSLLQDIRSSVNTDIQDSWYIHTKTTSIKSLYETSTKSEKQFDF